MRQWLDHHDLRDDPNAPVFCSSRPPYNRLSRGGLHIALHDATSAAGIKKRVHPHIYRHTCATEMARAGKQEAVMRESFGWELLSDMPGVYTHLSPDDVDRERLAMDGIVKEEDKPVNPNIQCIRCRELNNRQASYCWKCGMPLTEEGLARREKRIREVTQRMVKDQGFGQVVLDEIEDIPNIKAKRKNFKSLYYEY